MTKMLNLISVKTKLGALVVIPIAILIVTVFMSITSMKALIESVDTLHGDRVIPLKQIKVVSDNYAVNIVDLLHKYRAGILDEHNTLSQINSAKTLAKNSWQQYLSTYLTPQESILVEQAKNALTPVLALISTYENKIRSGALKSISAKEFNQELYTTFDPLGLRLAALIDLQLDEAEKIKKSADEKFDFIRKLFITTAIVVVILLSFGALQLNHSIQKPVNALKETILHIAKNTDLTYRAEIKGKDELAQMAYGFNQMLDKIHELVKDVHNATHSLAASAEEMSSISTQVSQTTSIQSEQSDAIASSINQMSTAIEDVANNAATSSELASNANKAAERGQSRIQSNIDSINQLAQTVDENTSNIGQLNKKIGEITQVVLMIQNVAEQTNLLALNAAIEAARAGDSGRGFAVVADEVRQLAHNTQNATSKINEMITSLQTAAQQAVESMENAQTNATASVEQAQESSQVLEEIVLAVDNIVDMNNQVSTTTEEQTTVASLISKNIGEFALNIKEVNDNASSNTQASSEVAHLASSLQEKIATFKV